MMAAKIPAIHTHPSFDLAFQGDTPRFSGSVGRILQSMDRVEAQNSIHTMATFDFTWLQETGAILNILLMFSMSSSP